MTTTTSKFQVAQTIDDLDEPDELPAVAITIEAGWVYFPEDGQ